ncbi:hypothetical protein C414_000210051 [Campylobacter jejuni subsp. jejuni 414]|nr:hypothetical protein C414_000210051 [Campylobacter jejuni subsp. jejuni 414]
MYWFDKEFSQAKANVCKASSESINSYINSKGIDLTIFRVN